MLYGGEESFKGYKEYVDDFSRPELKNNFEFMEMTIDEKQQDLWKRCKYIYENMGKKNIKDSPFTEFPYPTWGFFF